MASADGIEIERKYDLEGDPGVPDLVGVAAGGVRVASASPSREDRLDASYVDTDDLALAGRASALRRREGGRDAGWHLKAPAEEGRSERQWPLETPAASHDEGDGSDGSDGGVPGVSLPAPVAEAVAHITGGRPLEALARIRNRRVTIELLDAGGGVIAEVVDDHVDAIDERTGATRSWREWEVELGAAGPTTPDGRTSLLDAVEERLRTVGARPSSSSSKLARALGADRLG